MRRYIMVAVTALSLFAGNALAENIDHRLGVTGKLGVIVPLADSVINGSTFWFSNAGFTGGGGLIYGFGKYFAAELNVAHTSSLDVKMGRGDKIAEAGITDVGLGLQYRILPNFSLVPYLGLGADFIKGEIDNATLDWTYGGHVSGGFDYFLTRGIAVNVDCRALLAEKSDITMNGVKVGMFDPMNVTTTLGVRLFLPQRWW